MRKAVIKISSRRFVDKPTVERSIEFLTVEEFLEKADNAIEKACLSNGFVGVKCLVDNSDNVFSDDEIKILERNWFYFD